MQAGHRFQMSVEAPVEWVRLIRVAGALDRTAAAALLRLVDAQLELVVSGRCRVTDLLVDLEGVGTYESGGLTTLRHAANDTAVRGVRLHLTGCSARFHLLPLSARQVLRVFRTFPTVEIALAALTAIPPGSATGRADPTPPPRAQAAAPAQRPDGPGPLVPLQRRSGSCPTDRVQAHRLTPGPIPTARSTSPAGRVSVSWSS